MKRKALRLQLECFLQVCLVQCSHLSKRVTHGALSTSCAAVLGGTSFALPGPCVRTPVPGATITFHEYAWDLDKAKVQCEPDHKLHCMHVQAQSHE